MQLQIPVRPHNTILLTVNIIPHVMSVQYMLRAINQVLPDAVVVVAVERMVVRCDRLQVEPRLGQVEAAVYRVIGRRGRDRFVHPDQRDKDGEVDEGRPEGDLRRAESEWVLHGCEGALAGRRMAIRRWTMLS
jgi:hypothetical protein